jgi:hypothetical protein
MGNAPHQYEGYLQQYSCLVNLAMYVDCRTSTWRLCPSILRLFATILVFGEPSNVRGLWDKHLEAMGEDYHHNNPCKKEVEQFVLIDIRDMLQSMGKDIRSFPLPLIDSSNNAAISVP